MTIVAGLLLAATMTAWAADIRLPEGPGANLVYAKCQTCHDLQYVVDAKGLLPAQWRAVIASMHDYGLAATSQEDGELLTYLSTYLGKTTPPAAASSATQPAATAADGRSIYQQNCSTCHGPEGRGQPGFFPPLAGNPDLGKDNGAFPVAVVLHGLDGAIDVEGAAYNASMPPFGHLSDGEIAAVINFVRGAFGNDATKAAAAITQDMVAKRRAQAMTPAEVHTYRSSAGSGQ
ncbi:MAG TPA: c-type cytochrome [Casimicrobiaceae bacterium]